MSITHLVIQDIIYALAFFVTGAILHYVLLRAFTRKNVNVRLLIAAYAVGAVVSVSVLVGVEFPALVDGIQRHVKQSWVLGALIAVIICILGVRWFWEFRHYRRVWAVLAAYLVLHFLVGVPALGRFCRNAHGDIEELYMAVFAFSEGAMVRFALRRVTAPLRKTGE
jgi:lysylphosphatidylglycerol synthetase-like protein (DUF2156 family)